MSVLNQSGEEQVECPLCMEPLEVDDLNFFPCTCGYQICRFCWHRIRTDENGLCPACRKGYPENPADFRPLSQEDVSKLKAEKRHKDQQRKQKITENRKHLANVRVVQRNLVFVVGLPMRLADSEVLKKHEYFGKFGKIHKVVINQCTSYAGTQGPSASAYVTYQRADDALRAIQAVNNIVVDGRAIKSSLGTTKYCSHFMKNQACPKPDCMYLHEQGRGDPEASFTKEEMQQGKHQEYEKKLHDQLINATALTRERKPTPSPPAVVAGGGGPASQQLPAAGAVQTCAAVQQAGGKEAWPSLQPGQTGAGGNGGTIGSTTNGNTGKGENGRKQSSSKSGNAAKKRHSSGDDTRGKAKDKPSYCTAPGDSSIVAGPDESYDPLLLDDDSSPASSSTRSTSESVSVDSSDEGPPPAAPASPAARLAAAMAGGGKCSAAVSLFEQDNNSFFSSNSFTKVANSGQGTGLDWGSPHSHLPDMMPLPTVHPTEDWQAAFGFSDIPRRHPQQRDDRPHNGHHIPPDNGSPFEDFSVDQQQHGGDPSNPGQLFTSLHSQFGQPQQQHPPHHQHHQQHPQQQQQQQHDPVLYRHQYTQQQQQQHQQQQHVAQLHNGMPPTTSKFFSEYNLRHAQPPPQPLEPPSSHLGPADNYGKLGGTSANFAKPSLHDPASYCGEAPKTYDCGGYRPTFHMATAGGAYRGLHNGDDKGGGGGEEEGDDWGFDMFQETQKALAELMEKEAVTTRSTVPQQPPPGHFQFGQPPPQQGLFGHQQHQQMQQNHRLSGNTVSGCSRLLDGLGLGPTPQRSRLPPPGFSPAPNHMNAFGLGIPRPPTNNTGSKILPFMNLTSQTAPPAASPSLPSSAPHNGTQSMLFPPPPSPRTASTFNGGMKQQPLDLQFSSAASHKEWADNLRVFATSPPPPQQSAASHPPHGNVYGSQQHGGALKGWTGPCNDWTALDPAIVSSTRPPTQQQHNPVLLPQQQQQQHSASQQQQQHNATAAQHWLRHLEDNTSLFFGGATQHHHVDWAAALSAPPPGFTLRQQAQVAGINKVLAAGPEMTKIENL